jgi:hypothetical protein
MLGTLAVRPVRVPDLRRPGQPILPRVYEEPPELRGASQVSRCPYLGTGCSV